MNTLPGIHINLDSSDNDMRWSGCYFINVEHVSYLIYLSSASLDDLINELLIVHNFVESNGKKLLWI
jgi:hypothetical protein